MPFQILIMRLNIVLCSYAGKSQLQNNAFHSLLFGNTKKMPFHTAGYSVNYCYPSLTTLSFFFFFLSSVRFTKLRCKMSCIVYPVFPLLITDSGLSAHFFIDGKYSNLARTLKMNQICLWPLKLFGWGWVLWLCPHSKSYPWFWNENAYIDKMLTCVLVLLLSVTISILKYFLCVHAEKSGHGVLGITFPMCGLHTVTLSW